MSTDVRALLSEIAPRPGRRLDTRAIQRRGDRIRLGRRVLAVALSLPLVGGVVWAAGHLGWARRDASIAPAGHLVMVAKEPCEVSRDVDVTVFLKDGTSTTEARDLEFRIKRVSHVAEIVYVDQHDAWVEFKTVYRDYPKFWTHLPVDALPASIRVAVDEPEHVTAVVHAIPTPSVVDEVRTKKWRNPCRGLDD
jgi:FtsX extracellular domain